MGLNLSTINSWICEAADIIVVVVILIVGAVCCCYRVRDELYVNNFNMKRYFCIIFYFHYNLEKKIMTKIVSYVKNEFLISKHQLSTRFFPKILVLVTI